jgi:hypothetical protein
MSAGDFLFDRIQKRWDSRSNSRISAPLSCAATLPLTWSTRSVDDEAGGECRLPDRVRPRTGTCEWKDAMALNGRILSRLPTGSTTLRLSGRLF